MGGWGAYYARGTRMRGNEVNLLCQFSCLILPATQPPPACLPYLPAACRYIAFTFTRQEDLPSPALHSLLPATTAEGGGRRGRDGAEGAALCHPATAPTYPRGTAGGRRTRACLLTMFLRAKLRAERGAGPQPLCHHLAHHPYTTHTPAGAQRPSPAAHHPMALPTCVPATPTYSPPDLPGYLDCTGV